LGDETDGDAELLAFKPQFDPLFERWRKMSIEQRADIKDFEALVREKTGMTRAESEVLDQDDPEREAYRQTRMDLCGADRDCHYDREAWEPVSDQFHAVAGEILSHRATTREGFALQVRAFISSFSELWECESHLDDFIECLCAYAGVPFPPYGEGAPAIVAADLAPTEPDPIFAALERHREAWNDLLARCSGLADEKTPEGQAAYQALQDGCAAAEENLIETAPTTMAGAVALLRHEALMHKDDLNSIIDSELLADALTDIAREALLSETRLIATGAAANQATAA